jgi:hypothetical protein
MGLQPAHDGRNGFRAVTDWRLTQSGFCRRLKWSMEEQAQEKDASAVRR